jgi:hypothetical protein
MISMGVKKSINLTQAYDVLSQATAIVLEGRVLAPVLHSLEYDSAHEFFSIHWEEEELEFDIYFQEGDNNEVLIDGHTMTLISTEGEEEEIELLKEFNIEDLL